MSSTQEQLRRIEAKFRHLGAAKQRAEMEELTGLKRRYAHLHTPKHLTNPDHLGPKLSSAGAPLRIAAPYPPGRIPLQPTIAVLGHDLLFRHRREGFLVSRWLNVMFSGADQSCSPGNPLSVSIPAPRDR